MRRANFLRDTRGTSALEFAFVGPVFLLMVIGMLYGCLMLFSMASLHYAVEEGARCASVNTQTAYNGTGSPTFTSTSPACGHAVTGSTNFSFNMGVASWTVPLSATACFP
jgi:Flp pilus assembly protein TadG